MGYVVLELNKGLGAFARQLMSNPQSMLYTKNCELTAIVWKEKKQGDVSILIQLLNDEMQKMGVYFVGKRTFQTSEGVNAYIDGRDYLPVPSKEDLEKFANSMCALVKLEEKL